MIFPVLNARGFSIQLKELEIGKAIDLVKMSRSHQEQMLTEFLRQAVTNIRSKTMPADPRLWSISRRYLVMGQYLSKTVDGDEDYQIGEHTYYDYLQNDKQPDILPTVPYVFPAGQGVIGGDTWRYYPLTGWQIEAIEEIAQNYEDYLFLAVAACMATGDEARPDHTMPTTNYQEWLTARVEVFYKYPQSDFIALLALMRQGMAARAEFFDLWFNKTGVVALHHKEGIEGKTYQSARFLALDGIAETTKHIAGQPGEPGR